MELISNKGKSSRGREKSDFEKSQQIFSVRNQPANAGDTGSIPGPGRSHMPQSKQAQAPQPLRPHTLEPVLHDKKPAFCN